MAKHTGYRTVPTQMDDAELAAALEESDAQIRYYAECLEQAEARAKTLRAAAVRRIAAPALRDVKVGDRFFTTNVAGIGGQMLEAIAVRADGGVRVRLVGDGRYVTLLINDPATQTIRFA